jgi:hypothetical protein
MGGSDWPMGAPIGQSLVLVSGREQIDPEKQDIGITNLTFDDDFPTQAAGTAGLLHIWH